MPKPPETPPHSDIDGVARDAKDNVAAANEAGQDASNLELARREAAGKPAPSTDKGKDDRSA